MPKTISEKQENPQILLYQNEDGKIKFDVELQQKTAWLNQEQMAVLFGKARSTIAEHIQNIFKEGELEENLACRNFRHTTEHGAIKGKAQENDVKYYNLETIKFFQIVQNKLLWTS